jgi:hypothetical protein
MILSLSHTFVTPYPFPWKSTMLRSVCETLAAIIEGRPASHPLSKESAGKLNNPHKLKGPIRTSQNLDPCIDDRSTLTPLENKERVQIHLVYLGEIAA